MRRLALIALLAVALGACGEDDEAPAAAAALADLTVRVDPDGRGPQPARIAEVRCDAAGDSAVCREAATLELRVLEPPADAVACTQQYGGPQRGRLTGTLRGERVDATLSRTNGCEIARWEAAAALLRTAE